MKVCVIIANFNHSKWLESSIASALNQTYRDIEVLVVDDGSNDKDVVKKIVESAQLRDSRVVYLDLPTNKGKWHALNEAIKTTSCELITTLDADDVCPEDRIARQVDVFKLVPGTLHVLSGFHHCWSEEEVNQNLKKTQTGPLQVIPHETVRNMVIAGFSTPGINHYYTGDIETAGASAMFHRQVWDLGIRFNPPRVGLRTLLSEDSDFNFRLTALLGRTAILNERLYCYRRNTSTNEEAM